MCYHSTLTRPNGFLFVLWSFMFYARHVIAAMLVLWNFELKFCRPKLKIFYTTKIKFLRRFKPSQQISTEISKRVCRLAHTKFTVIYAKCYREGGGGGTSSYCSSWQHSSVCTEIKLFYTNQNPSFTLVRLFYKSDINLLHAFEYRAWKRWLMDNFINFKG